MKPYFFLEEWASTIVFSERSAHGDTSTVASINMNLPYFEYEMTVYPSLLEYWKEQDYEYLVDTVAHELSHILTQPLYQIAARAVSPAEREQLEQVREQQTQRITNVVMRGLPPELFKPKEISRAKRA